MTPTGRTLFYLRRLGFVAAPCELFIPAVQRKRDLFGIADVIGFHVRDRQPLLVQCTSLAHVRDRLARIKARPELPLLLRAGVAVECWGWTKRGEHWHVERVAVRPDDLPGVVVESPRHRRRRRGERQRNLFDSADLKKPYGRP